MIPTLAEAYVHTLDPFAIEFPSSWPVAGLRWYGLSYAVGFLCAWWLMRWMSKTGRSVMPTNAVGDVMTAVIIGVLAGGRLGYALFYQPSLFIGFSADFPWWDLLAINKGGMASHGGMIGMIVACWIVARKHRFSALHLFDVCAFVGAPGLFLGRLANFVNAELWGRRLAPELQADPPSWSVKYPEDILAIPTESLSELAPAMEAINQGAATWMSSVERIGVDPEAARFVDSTLARLVVAAQDGNQAVIEVVRPFLDAYYPSQLLQAVTDGPLLMGTLALVWLKPRRPGVVGCWFLMTYGALRIATEVFRQPDEGVALLAGLSRGQILSLAMIAAGAVLLPVMARRDVEPIGGLLRS